MHVYNIYFDKVFVNKPTFFVGTLTAFVGTTSLKASRLSLTMPLFKGGVKMDIIVRRKKKLTDLSSYIKVAPLPRTRIRVSPALSFWNSVRDSLMICCINVQKKRLWYQIKQDAIARKLHPIFHLIATRVKYNRKSTPLFANKQLVKTFFN